MITRQIGWSNESNLLYQILKQITRLTSTLFSLKQATIPKYKVFTALLTQDGENLIQELFQAPLVIGRTYTIGYDDGGPCDFTNVGAPNNNTGTSFIATGTTPNAFGGYYLEYNQAYPTAIVLENTIGNIWFTYNGTGNYLLNSFLELPISTFTYIGDNIGKAGVKILINSITSPTIEIQISVLTRGDAGIDSQLVNTPIEIRIYN